MKSKTECCNGNCNQGRDCPMRTTKKYRVKSTTYLNDTGGLTMLHYPQEKKWWGWKNISTHAYGPPVVFYGKCGDESALEFLAKYKEKYPKTEYRYE
jgi:hypothetical protein